VLIAGWASAVTIVATGTTINEAYLTEYWKTFFRVCWSFFASNLEKAGNIIVRTGVAKKEMRTTKFRDTL